MSTLAPTIEAFFTERLMAQRQASQRTIASYRDTIRMLLVFAERRTGKPPAHLEVADVNAGMVSDFLDHLEQERHNTARTRNARLAAIHSLLRFAFLRHPEHAHSIQQVLAIPSKRHDRRDVDYLTPEETDALLAAAEGQRWIERRDHALLVLMIQTGLRVSELCRLTCGDLHLGTGPHVVCRGKGRKGRATPLTPHTVGVLRTWMKDSDGEPEEPLFPTTTGRSMSVDAVQWLVAKYAARATGCCPSLGRKRVSPHVLRHTCAMNLLHAGVDSAVIALWLGHESTQTTQIYLHADMAIKEKAIGRTAPPNTKTSRYRPVDPLLTFLEGL